VNVANNYTTSHQLLLHHARHLTESACFVNPKAMTGTGQVSLRSTPHLRIRSAASKQGARMARVGGGGASLACLFLLGLPRRRGRGSALFVLTLHGHPLHRHRMRRHGEDRSRNSQGYLHRCGHGDRKQRLIAGPGQRECPGHDPVSTRERTSQPGEQEMCMSTEVRRIMGKVARALCVVGVLSAALAWASVGGSIAGTVKDPRDV
jgi:hypothetical protein